VELSAARCGTRRWPRWTGSAPAPASAGCACRPVTHVAGLAVLVRSLSAAPSRCWPSGPIAGPWPPRAARTSRWCRPAAAPCSARPAPWATPLAGSPPVLLAGPRAGRPAGRRAGRWRTGGDDLRHERAARLRVRRRPLDACAPRSATRRIWISGRCCSPLPARPRAPADGGSAPATRGGWTPGAAGRARPGGRRHQHRGTSGPGEVARPAGLRASATWRWWATRPGMGGRVVAVVVPADRATRRPRNCSVGMWRAVAALRYSQQGRNVDAVHAPEREARHRTAPAELLRREQTEAESVIY